jgi:hypothetical protein
MLGKIVKLAIFLLIANALYQVAPAWVHYYEFRDSLKELALYSHEKSDGAVVDRVMALAEEHHVPLDRDAVEVRRTPEQGQDELAIRAPYVEMLKVVPGYTYRWDANVEVSALRVKPPTGVAR